MRPRAHLLVTLLVAMVVTPTAQAQPTRSTIAAAPLSIGEIRLTYLGNAGWEITDGRTVVLGPLTLMPDDTQAVVAYLDHWAWDFGEHLVYLQITVRDPLTPQPYASVTFSTRVSLREQTAATVTRLVDSLLGK